MNHRRNILTFATIVLGALLTSECARLASAGHEADERETRGAQLEELHEALADLESDDIKTREDAQECILALSYSFDDEVAVAFATTQSLEVKTRLTEILDRWNRQMLDDAIAHVSLMGYRPGDHRMAAYLEHVRTCPVCHSQRKDVASGAVNFVSSTTSTTSTTSGAAWGYRVHSSSGSCGIGADW